jgi:DNA-binding PadR family transcriptional regulator
MRVTYEKLKILNALASGNKTHRFLRMVYYGEIRFKNPSNTSFYNQLQRLMDRALIVKPAEGVYQITEAGKEAIASSI